MQKLLRPVLGLVIALFAVLAAPRAASAREIYVNGVRIANSHQLRMQELTNASVRFDAAGNVWISAPDYHVEIIPGRPLVVPAPPVVAVIGSTRYYLTWTNSPVIGRAQYNFDVVVNGKVISRVMANDPSNQRDITAFIQQGTNNVRIIANKDISQGGRLSSSDEEAMTVSVSQGHSAGGAIVIDDVLLEMRRSAFDTDTFFADAMFNTYGNMAATDLPGAR
jgi:hypothetical protein